MALSLEVLSSRFRHIDKRGSAPEVSCFPLKVLVSPLEFVSSTLDSPDISSRVLKFPLMAIIAVMILSRLML